MTQPPRNTLGQLMERYLDGDSRAFRGLFDLLRPRLRRQMSGFISDPDALDDVVQQVFMHAHLRRDSFVWPAGGGDRAVMAWYGAIARNRAIDHLRRRGRTDHRTTPIDEGSAMETRRVDHEQIRDQEETLLVREAQLWRTRRVREAIESLPPGQREVVELHKLRGMTMDEIAERTGVRAGTLRVRAHRAYRSLATLLSSWGRRDTEREAA